MEHEINFNFEKAYRYKLAGTASNLQFSVTPHLPSLNCPGTTAQVT
jgi:hypothetical protein